MTKIQIKKIPKLLNSLLLASLVSVFIASPLVEVVKADQYTDQINQLKSENAQKQDVVRGLHIEAENISGVIAALQTQINGLQVQINANQAKANQLQTEITAAEIELAKQKNLMGQNIRAMYLEGDISTLEMLASSKTLGEFMDKQQYRDAVKDKIKATLDRVNALKAQLKSAKEETERLIAEDNRLKAQADASKAEQDRLLGFNQSQQAEYNNQIKSNQGKIAELRKAQAAANAQFTAGTGVACGGGYPGSANGPFGRWGCNYPLDNTIDNWGMYNRECVSYTAFKVSQSGRRMPYWGGYGNANQWDDNARAQGIPVDGNPRVGDVAVSNFGYYGHVMYVEHVYEDGRILISQYNASWDGRYSEAVIRPGSLVFIHFP